MSSPQRSMKSRNLPPLTLHNPVSGSGGTRRPAPPGRSNGVSGAPAGGGGGGGGARTNQRPVHPIRGNTEITEELVSTYLRDHPDFLNRFVIDKIPAARVQGWSQKMQQKDAAGEAKQHPAAPSIQVNQPPNNHQDSGGAAASSRGLLAPASGSNSERPNTSTRRALIQRSKMLEELTRDIYSRPSKARILCELKDTIASAVNADGANLYLVDDSGKEIYYYNPTLQNDKDSSACVKKIGSGSTLAAYVAEVHEPKRVDDICADDRFPEGLPPSTEMAQSVLAQPILQDNGRVAGVVELYRTVGKQPFAHEDEEVMNTYLVWGTLAVSCSEMYHKNSQQQKLNEFILHVTQSMFGKFKSMEYVIKDIMNYAQSLVAADRASLFLVDNKSRELYARLFDVGNAGLPGYGSRSADPGSNPPSSPKDWDKHKEIRFPMDRGIAGHVATTGETLNICDAYSDPRFNREIDQQTGYTTKTILCMPVKLQEEIIGVVQMLNKIGSVFTEEDESQFRTFATYCGLALHIAKMYEKIRRSEQKYKVALEVLSYHSRFSEDEMSRVKAIDLPDNIPTITRFDYSPWEVDDDRKSMHVLYMFRDLFGLQSGHSSSGLTDEAGDQEQPRPEPVFDQETLLRFTLTVKKNYRRVPYHNWAHAFSVAHAMYTIIKTPNHHFNTDECLALFVACLCHDLDHRGKTNQFMVKSSSPLAAIYSTSTMEHHHFNMTVSILQRDGHNIFKHLSSDQYKRVLGNIKHCIIATDLAKFFEYKGKLDTIMKEDAFKWDNYEHRLFSMACTMTASDLCSMYKPWRVQLSLVMVIMEEFYNQGDEEKKQNQKPIPMMDRDLKHQLPDSQVGFIKAICLPCYNLLYQILPDSEPMVKGAQSNLDSWQQLADLPNEEKVAKLAQLEKEAQKRV